MGHREIAKTNWRRCTVRHPDTYERCPLVSGHDGPHSGGYDAPFESEEKCGEETNRKDWIGREISTVVCAKEKGHSGVHQSRGLYRWI
jgi:hypothetical protein